MKVKKLEKYLNKVGSKGCNRSSLNAPSTETPLPQSIIDLGELANWVGRSVETIRRGRTGNGAAIHRSHFHPSQISEEFQYLPETFHPNLG